MAALVVEEEARRKLSVVVEPKEDLEVEALEGEVVRAVDLLDLVSVVVEKAAGPLKNRKSGFSRGNPSGGGGKVARPLKTSKI